MRFMVQAWDHPDGGIEKRNELRPEHTRSIREWFDAGHVILGAGIKDDDGALVGSLVVLDVADRAEVDRYLAGEPFATGGVWERIEVRELLLPDHYLQRPPSASPPP